MNTSHTIAVSPCPSCQTLFDRSAGECSNCGHRVKETVLANTFREGVIRPKIMQPVQFTTEVDATGSSGPFAKGVALSLEIILNELAKKVADITTWVQIHRDEDDGDMPQLLTNGGTVRDAISDIGRIKYHRGGDNPETHLSGIEDLFNRVPWESRATGVMLVFTTDETKPARSGKSPRELAEAIRNKGVLFYMISEPTPKLNELVEAADGMMFQISNSPSEGEMKAIAAQVGASVTHTIATGATVPLQAPGGVALR